MENIFDQAAFSFILPLFIALVLGLVIGTERVWAHKTAGMRTYALVAMGSCLFVLVSIEAVKLYNTFTGISPLYIAAQIIVGVGFIGTGLIFTKESKLMGLTTATGLWVCAGIGMACGFGIYTLAIIATLLTLFIFTVLWFLEQQLKKTKFYIESHPDDH